MADSMYPCCGVCKIGTLLPVALGQGAGADVEYRCTNADCGVRFDKQGYARYDMERQCWKHISDG